MRTALICLGIVSLGSIVSGQATAPNVVKISTNGSSYIGVMVQEIDSERAKALKLREEAGVEITRVEPDGPAEKGGLKVGDAVVQYNGERVEGMEQFKRLVNETPVGREVKLEIVRAGAPQNVIVKIGQRRPVNAFTLGSPAFAPQAMRSFEMRMPDIPRSFLSWRSSALGIEGESLEGQLAAYFGVKEGVLVRSVMKASAAEKAGIRAGDVITGVDNSKIATPADLSSRIRSLRGKQASVTLMRDRKEITVSVAIDENDRSQGWFEGAPRVIE